MMTILLGVTLGQSFAAAAPDAIRSESLSARLLSGSHQPRGLSMLVYHKKV